MKRQMMWQQRVCVTTGLSCWQILLHMLVIGVAVAGWLSGAPARVGLVLCVLYAMTLALMLVCQRHSAYRWRVMGDALEALTTAWYSGAAIIAVWLLSRVLHNHVVLVITGVVILAGPALTSLLAKSPRCRAVDYMPEQRLRR